MLLRFQKAAVGENYETGNQAFSMRLRYLTTRHDIVILLHPAKIVENIHDAYDHPRFRDKAYSLLMSGPSGSADSPRSDDAYRHFLAMRLTDSSTTEARSEKERRLTVRFLLSRRPFGVFRAGRPQRRLPTRARGVSRR